MRASRIAILLTSVILTSLEAVATLPNIPGGTVYTFLTHLETSQSLEIGKFVVLIMLLDLALLIALQVRIERDNLTFENNYVTFRDKVIMFLYPQGNTN
jgi:hypothetical protein